MSSNKEEVRKSIFSAVSCGDVEKVEELVGRHGVSYSPDFCGGYELLFNASFFGYKKIFKYLLEKGASVNSGTNNANTPLHFAAWFGDSELVQLLLDHKALIDAKDQQYETPLHVVCRRGHENVVELLLDRGANVNLSREDPATYEAKFAHMKIGRAAFAAACQIGHEGFKEVLNFGAQVGSLSYQEPLHLSSKNYRTRVCQNVKSDSGSNRQEPPRLSSEIYSKNVSTNTDSESNVTPLHIASELGLLKIVKLLLNKGAFVNAQTDKHSTPLLLAVKNGLTDVAKILFEHGACINTKDDKNSSPLYIALETRNWRLVRYILQLKPGIYGKIRKLVLDIITHDEYTWNIIIDDFIAFGFFSRMSNPEDVRYSSLLQSAIRQGYTNLVRYLLKDGGNLLIGNHGFAPLHVAVESGHEDIIVLLLDLGCKVNSKDKSDKTPLSYSLSSNQKTKHMELIQLLLNRGADLKMAPGLLHEAIRKMNTEVCKLLLESGACVNALDENNRTPFYHASMLLNSEHNTNSREESSETSISYFMKNNRDSKCAKIIQLLLDFGADMKGAPDLLHEAVSEQNIEVCKVLVKNGADVNALDKYGLTPLHRAASERHGFSNHVKLELQQDTRSRLEEIAKRSYCEMALIAGLSRSNSQLDGPSVRYKKAESFNLEVASTSRHGAPSEKCHSFNQSNPEARKEITKFLLDNNADWTIKTQDGLTALHLGIIYEKEDTIRILLDCKADVDSRTSDGSTPLHLACDRGRGKIIHALLDNGADIEAITQKAYTPLHRAVLGGHLDVVKMLVNSNVEVNARGSSNETVLHYAVKKNKSKIIEVLLDNGCDVNAENIEGKTALRLIASLSNVFSSSSIVEELQKHLIKLNVAGLCVSEQNLQLLDRHSARELSPRFKRKCSEEMSRLKYEWNDGYKLLHVFESPGYLGSVKKKSLIRNIRASEFGKYPIYESLLRYNYSECQVRLEMITSGRKWLSFLLTTSNTLNVNKLPTLPTEILEEVISYLTKRDLNRLICCGKKLKLQLSK